MDKILVVAAHPDDDILGCGATIAKLIDNGKKCRIIFIAEGTSARYENLQNDQKIIANEIELRTKYAKEALSEIGCNDYEFYNLPCARLDSVPLIEIGKIIEKEIKKFNPDTIFTHSENDTNNDHKIVFQATLQATRPNALNLVKRLYSFEILSSSEWRFSKTFEPNYFVTFEKKYLDKKNEALAKYKSEIKSFPYPRSREGIETLAKLRGMQIGSNYAEAFKLIRGIE